MKDETYFAIVRHDGAIQKTYDVRFESTQPEIYTSATTATFIRDKAYPTSRVVQVRVVAI